MQWVRIHPFIQNWPGGGSPPVFDISADENGSAVIELAWDPQALRSPSTYAPNPLRYYSTEVLFNERLTNDDGTVNNVNIPPQTITLVDNHATWTMPADLWNAYLQESLKTLNSPPNSTFSHNIYYRVRVTPPGSSSAVMWPDDATLRGPFAQSAPHIGMLRISATPSSQVIPDEEAIGGVNAVPGIPSRLTGEIIRAIWRDLPESDTNRQSLAALFGHAVFRSSPAVLRSKLLVLWLFAGPWARRHMSRLLDRRTMIGSNVVTPIIEKTDLRGGKSLVDNLLALLTITPHPDMAAVTTHEQLLDDVIREILDPNGQINQGAAGTCVVTTIQTLLIGVNPAEYARLMVGLLSRQGTTRLANGDQVSIPAAIYQIARYATGVGGSAFLMRTYSELGFQATMIRYGQGSRFPALIGTPQNINQIFQQTISAGLFSNETKRVLDGIFNVNFTTHYIPSPATMAQWQAAQPGLRDGFVRDLPGLQQAMVLDVFWGAPYSSGHGVLGIRRDNSRIFFKNPQYPGSAPAPGVAAGGNATNPPRRYEDPTQSLESITEADLSTWIRGYWVPATAIG
ncbi:MAG: hypothetical protein KJ065_07420 [Anaerolineae bacterium]|nr:hypothetical protein [Anaerolineae bacterium]